MSGIVGLPAALTGLAGVGNLVSNAAYFVPMLVAAIAYFNYDVMDPESRPINVPTEELWPTYDFIIEAPWHTPLAAAFVQAGVELGYENRDCNGEHQTGFMIAQGTTRRGARCSTGKAFLRPARLRKGLHVAMNAHVTRVLIDPKTKVAYGVEFRRDGTMHRVRASREVILSGGAINSPQLLMLSGVGPRDHLRSLGIPVIQDLKVGHNLQDHIGLGGFTFMVNKEVSMVQNRIENVPAVLRYAMFGDGPLTVLGGVEGLAFVNTKYANATDDWPDIEFHFVGLVAKRPGVTMVSPVRLMPRLLRHNDRFGTGARITASYGPGFLFILLTRLALVAFRPDIVDRENRPRDTPLARMRASYDFIVYYSHIAEDFLEAGRELGIRVGDVNGEVQSGFMKSHGTLRQGLRCSASKAFLRPASKRPNLHVSMFSAVQRIVVVDGRAAGVIFRKAGRPRLQVALANREVLLAAGAVQSPQLLMVSGVGPAAHLRAVGVPVAVDSPGVGGNLQDHVALGGTAYLIDSPPHAGPMGEVFVLPRAATLNTLLGFITGSGGPMYAWPQGEVMGFISTKYANQSDDWPDVQLFLASSSDASDGGVFNMRNLGVTDEVYASVYEPILYREAYSVVPLLLRPRSRGTVRLRSPDMAQPPLIDPNYLADPRDVEILVEGAKAGYQLMGTRAMRALNATLNPFKFPACAHLPHPSDEYWACQCPYSDSTFLRGVCGPSLAIFLGIIEMVLRDSCDVAEPCRRARADAFARRGHQAFDYIVVGAGVAGSVLAEDLVRAGNELLGYESPPDLNGGNQTGFTIAQMMVYKGLRGSTARMYLRPSMGRPNLVVNTEALVSKVVIDAERGRATGVEFIDKNGVKQTVRAKREVVVCAGAVGSPQLLLLSGLGPTEELEAVGVTPVADLPVGRNLHNHVAATIHYVVDDLAGRSVADSESDDEDYYERDDDEVGPMSMAALHRFLQRRSGPLASTGLTQVTAFLASKYAENRVPDIQIFFDGFHAGCQSELQPALRCAPPNATHSRGDFYDVQV
ncbi:Glucose dehydrogenase acceptor-like, partial [Frankliniella occidentalis]